MAVDSFSTSELPTLRTERLVLRPLEETDAALHLAIWSDAERAKLFGRPAPSLRESEERFARLWARHLTGDVHGWVLTREGSAIGTVGLCRFNFTNGMAEVAYELLAPHRRQGFATEALSRIVAHALDVGLRRLEGHVDPWNTDSMRVLERSGFVRDAVLPDTVVYARVLRAA